MEELSLKLPNRPDVRQMVQLAAQEFEANRRGVVIATEQVTLVGQKL